jgi:molecular chaperone GrpE
MSKKHASESGAQPAAADHTAAPAFGPAAAASKGSQAGKNVAALDPVPVAEAAEPAAAEAAAAEAAAAEVAAAAEFAAKLAALEADNSALKDQYLRKAAEFENFRKRMQKEKQDAIDFANQAILLDLIQVIDDFERAIKASESSKDYASFAEGISMIEKRLVSQLESKWGLVRFESAGQPFDPNRHEAVMMDKSADVAEPVVGEDFVRGYTLKERVVRSAKVKVIMPLDATSGA